MELFDLLKSIEKNENSLFSKLDDKEKADLNPYMIMRWLSYCNDPKQIQHINMFMNTKVFAMGNHKELLYKLACASATGKHNYKWLKRNNKKQSAILNMIATAHGCGLREAQDILELYSKKDLLDLCDELNLDKPEKEKLKKEIDVL